MVMSCSCALAMWTSIQTGCDSEGRKWRPAPKFLRFLCQRAENACSQAHPTCRRGQHLRGVGTEAATVPSGLDSSIERSGNIFSRHRPSWT